MGFFGSLSDLQQRLIVGSLAAILVILSITFSQVLWFQPIFVLLTGCVIVLALWEYYQIATTKKYYPLAKIGIIGSFLYSFAIYAYTQTKYAEIIPDIVLGVILIAAFTYYFIKGADPFVNLAVTFFGIVYLTVPLNYLIKINYFRHDDWVTDGRWALIYLLFVTKVTDAAAFFVGNKFGKRKLTPYISPKKTWEGAIGGLLGAILISVIFFAIFNLLMSEKPFPISFWQMLWLPILISVAGQFGDLAESLLKRDVGVKNSSHLPGLGGILDTVDSLIFASPIMYFFLKMQVST